MDKLCPKLKMVISLLILMPKAFLMIKEATVNILLCTERHIDDVYVRN